MYTRTLKKNNLINAPRLTKQNEETLDDIEINHYINRHKIKPLVTSNDKLNYRIVVNCRTLKVLN